jgi:hypothetical protein
VTPPTDAVRQQWWYLRKAVPWAALLGCCVGAVAAGLLLERWPGSAFLLLPALLACCAAAAGFAFDEVTLPVVEVTPRGSTWRRVARLGVALVPLVLWGAVLWLQPGDLRLDRGAWWAVGSAAIVLAAGAAALASRLSVAAPGGVLAPVVAIALIGPLVVTSLLGWSSVYPFGNLTAAGQGLWWSVGGAGVLTCVVALRPGLSR